MNTITTAPAQAELHTLTLFPTIDGVEFFCGSFAGHAHTPMTWLMEFARMNDFALVHDSESDERTQGWHIERNRDGVRVFAAVVTA